MKYTIRIPAMASDVFPLFAIAHAMAHARATEGGKPRREKAYQATLRRVAGPLLQEALAGRLRTCDQDGLPVDPSFPPASADTDDFEIEVLTEPGLRRDEEMTRLVTLYTKTAWVREWASGNGDEIVVAADMEWLDEDGVVKPVVGVKTIGRGPAANDGDEPSSRPTTDVPTEKTDSMNARETEQERQDRRLDRLFALGGDCKPASKGWRVTGGLLKQIDQEERDAGRKQIGEKAISEDIRAAYARRRQPEMSIWGHTIRK